jgi:hypothetical protein
VVTCGHHAAVFTPPPRIWPLLEPLAAQYGGINAAILAASCLQKTETLISATKLTEIVFRVFWRQHS